MEQTKIPTAVYTEITPNPEALKFVVNQMLIPNGKAEYKSEDDAKKSPLALELFGFPFVREVFVSQNYITIIKITNYEWQDVMGTLREFITNYLRDGKPVITEMPVEEEGSITAVDHAEDDETVRKIKDVLDNYVQPAVEQDGGFIKFRSYRDGVVSVELQGACSGCPSSMVTLKSGIEGMMTKMVPGVTEVVAIEY